MLPSLFEDDLSPELFNNDQKSASGYNNVGTDFMFCLFV